MFNLSNRYIRLNFKTPKKRLFSLVAYIGFLVKQIMPPNCYWSLWSFCRSRTVHMRQKTGRKKWYEEWRNFVVDRRGTRVFKLKKHSIQNSIIFIALWSYCALALLYVDQSSYANWQAVWTSIIKQWICCSFFTYFGGNNSLAGSFNLAANEWLPTTTSANERNSWIISDRVRAVRAYA